MTRLYVYVAIVLLSVLLVLPSGWAGVSEDIELLDNYSQEAQMAAYRLFDAGDATLAQAHPLLDDADQPKKRIIQLVSVVGELGNPSSIPHLVNAAKNFSDNSYVVHNVFMALARMPQHEDALELTNDILNADSSRHKKRSALWYYAAHRDERGRAAAEAIIADDSKSAAELRDVALHLLARLGDSTTKEPIAKMLKTKQRSGIQYNLMMALAEVASVKEFESQTAHVNQKMRTYRSALRRVKFNNGSDDEKTALTDKMLHSTYVEDKHVAIAHLLKTGNYDALSPFLLSTRAEMPHPMSPVIRGVATRENIAIAINDKNVEFKRNEEK